MTHAALQISSPIALIAAGGTLPFAVADSLLARGIKPTMFALKGLCDPMRVNSYHHHWITLGQLGKLMKLIRSENCRDVLFIGSLTRPAVGEVRLDWFMVRALPKLLNAFRGGDDHLLSGLGRLFEQQGFRLVGLKDAASNLLMPEGCLTAAAPDGAAAADIARGRGVLQALSPFDVGQAAVVIDAQVVGVEDIAGTDALLARIVQLRAEGRLRAKIGRGVLVKAPKTTQDLRYDLPALGPRTVAGAKQAGLAGIATLAGNAVVAEPQALIDAADAASIFVVGFPA